jgi:hypothetical protein
VTPRFGSSMSWLGRDDRYIIGVEAALVAPQRMRSRSEYAHNGAQSESPREGFR